MLEHSCMYASFEVNDFKLSELIFRRGLTGLLATYTINAVMGSVTQYHCEKCNIEFPSLAELNYHQISKHSNVPD
jgi:hypothetical protein